MKIAQLISTRHWFESYVGGFADESGKLVPLMRVKKEHSLRVETNVACIARSLHWEDARIRLADAVGLLHDVGRFGQFRDYGTYYDGDSIDHGDAGAETLENAFPWGDVDAPVRGIILDAVRHHNKKTLPADLASGSLPFARIVRDGDKLDVYQLVQGYVREGRVSDLLPRIRADGPLSPALCDEVRENGAASYASVRSLADFLLVQLTWALDLNYSPSFDMLRERGYVEWIEGRLPRDGETRSLLKDLEDRIRRRRTSLPE